MDLVGLYQRSSLQGNGIIILPMSPILLPHLARIYTTPWTVPRVCQFQATLSNPCSIDHPDPSKQHMFASLSASFSNTAVVLEHSAFIQDIRGVDEGLNITFTTRKSFEYAMAKWGTDGCLIIVTHSHDCGDGQRAYWKVGKIVFEDGSFTACLYATEIAVEQAVNELDMEWGTYSPSRTSRVVSSTREDSFSSANIVTSSIAYYTSSSPSPSNDAFCATPIASIIDGFPAAPCGENFDTVLDEALGYLSFDDDSFSSSLEAFAPGLGDFDENDYQDSDAAGSTTVSPSRHSGMPVRSFIPLEKRFFSLRAVFQKLSKSISGAAKAGFDAAAKIVTAALSDAKKVYDFAKDLKNGELSPAIDKEVNINVKAARLTESPWGPAYSMFEIEHENKKGTISGSLDAYCVDCGVEGKVNLNGHVQFSIGAGIPFGFGIYG